MAGKGTSSGSDRKPTKEAILETAIEVLERRGSERFTVDEVLVESGVSASSLYHHFGNREGLLVAVQEARYHNRFRREDPRNLDGGLSARTTQEFFDYVTAQLVRIATDPETVAARRDRLQVLARALDSPELEEHTGPLQSRLIDAVAEMFEDARARGLIAADLDARAYSAWFHGLTLGRTFTEDTIDAEAWLAIAIPAALAPLQPTPPRSAGDEPPG
jgi:AcrR family transcriptional regulator